MLTAVYAHLLITAALAALLALVVGAQFLTAAVRSSRSRSARRDTARPRHRPSRVADSRA